MYKVLVVDDDSDILKVLEILLTMKNLEAKTLSKASEVHQTVSVFKPTVILLDVNLGPYDGREICAEIKSNPETQKIPVILFSANHNISESAFASGADDFLEKPFDVQHMIEIIQNLCNKATVNC